MRAVLVERYGGPEVLTLQDRDAPRPEDGEVLVDVAAAGVNYLDIYQREGRYASQPPFPFVLGQEGAGTVASVGQGVQGLAAGDAVAWSGVQGSYAEQVVLAADRAVPVPAGVELRLAAAVMLQGMTAHYLAHTTYPVQAGDVAVVHSAAGGVGLLLTQLVKQRGGLVVATTSSAEKDDLARAARADHAVRYDAFRRTVADVTDGAGAGVVYDGVGQATFDDSLAALGRRGMMVLYGASSGPVPPFELQRLAGGGSLYLTRPTLVHHVASRADLEQRSGDLFRAMAAGSLDVRIGATYPLADAARAHEDLAGRRTTGKLLLLPG